MKKKVKIMLFIISILVVASICVWGIDLYVRESVKEKIIDEKVVGQKVEAILVLGCQVKPDGTLSLMLQDRLNKALALYEQKVSDKIIVSGDHGTNEYDEVNAMKRYLMEHGVVSEAIFMDHAGFSTYESIYRAKHIFEANKIVIVTQEYHLYRALYVAKSLGIDAYGVCAQKVNYDGQMKRELREILARNKDFVQCIWKTEPTYLGESIPISGNGDSTNDNT